MSRTVTLDAPPSLTGLYGRALRGALPIPGLGGGSGSGLQLPDTVLEIPQTELERDHIVAYERVCGFRVDDVCPWTYPHMLGFPLQMALMTESDFPFRVMGLIHLENRIVSHRPLRAGEQVGVRAWAQNVAEHARGRTVELCVGVTVDGEAAWESTSTYLQRGGGSGERKEHPPEPAGQRHSESPQTIWQIPADAGRRYASVSGDRNPIHMHPLSAKLLGMPTAIAHGMWMKARCLAALEADVPRERAIEADVRFKLPVRLPSRVSFTAHEHDGRWDFEVRDGKGVKPHLSGTLIMRD